MYLHIFAKGVWLTGGNKFQKPTSIILVFLTILWFSSAAQASPGDLDPSFGNGGIVVTSTGTGIRDEARGLAIQTDGKIIALASTYNISDQHGIDTLLIRYNTNGTLDSTFGSGGTVITDISGIGKRDFPRAVVLQSDGRIVIAGSIDNGVNFDFAIARYNTDGTLDTAFGNGGIVVTQIGIENDTCDGLTIQSDGKIIAGGQTGSPGSRNYALVRYNTNGTLDPTFDTDGILTTDFNGQADGIQAVKIQSDGKIVAVGSSSPTGGTDDFALARYNSDGTLDTGFATGGKLILDINVNKNDFAWAAAIQTDGRIIAAGYSSTNNPNNEFVAARLNANGTADNDFGTNGIVKTPFIGAQVVSSAALQADGKIIVVGSGSGKFAIVRYNINGTLDTTFGTGGIVNDQSGITSAVAIQPDSKIVAAGYVNSDRDVQVVRYLADSNTRPAQFDFDGDGKADVSVFRPDNGVWYLLNSQNGFSAAQFGISTDKLAPADYDGDGKTDIAVFRDGIWYWLISSNGSFSAVQFGIAGDIPQPADFDGDGRAEAAVYRGGVWYVLNLANNQFSAVQFGIASDKPVVADYDGDGRADFAVYRDGVWYLLQSTQGFTAVQFGIASDQAIPADYDGDGKTDLAVYRDGIWYLLQSQTGFAGFQFGIATDLPVPADYDGDGRADAAVFRDGIWYLLNSTNGFAAVSFGTTDDKPIPNAFIP